MRARSAGRRSRGASSGSARGCARRSLRDVLAVDADDAGRRAVEPGEQPQQRRLAGAARAEDREHLAVLDAEREPLQRRRVSLRRRVHAEDVLQLDALMPPTSAARSGARPRSIVAPATSSVASSDVGGRRRCEERQVEREAKRRLRLGGARGHRDERDDERGENRAEREPAGDPERADEQRAQAQVRADRRRRCSLRLEVEQLAAVVAHVADDREQRARRARVAARPRPFPRASAARRARAGRCAAARACRRATARSASGRVAASCARHPHLVRRPEPRGSACRARSMLLTRSAITASPTVDGKRCTTPTTRAATCSPSTCSGITPLGPASAATCGVASTRSSFPSVGSTGRNDAGPVGREDVAEPRARAAHAARSAPAGERARRRAARSRAGAPNASIALRARLDAQPGVGGDAAAVDDVELELRRASRAGTGSGRAGRRASPPSVRPSETAT